MDYRWVECMKSEVSTLYILLLKFGLVHGKDDFKRKGKLYNICR
jgi:hypothetical protein